MLAVSPEHQGKGVGRMIMRIISALADQDAIPVHLEVSGSRNKAYFEQCGFRTMETIDVCSEVIFVSLQHMLPDPSSPQCAFTLAAARDVPACSKYALFLLLHVTCQPVPVTY